MVYKSRRSTSGFALLESLIAVIVVAIGLLGVAGMQLTAMRYGQSAYMRSIATLLAADIAERMRANSPAVADGRYNMGSNLAASPTQKTDCFGESGCTADQMAANDLYEWTREVASRLPGSVAVVCLDSSPDDGTATAPACDGVGANFAVKLWWSDERSGLKQRFVKSFQP